MERNNINQFKIKYVDSDWTVSMIFTEERFINSITDFSIEELIVITHDGIEVNLIINQ